MIDNATAQMVQAAIEDGGALLAFAFIVLGSFALCLLLLLFFLLGIRAVWRGLLRWTWGGVIVHLERKALRQ